VKAAAMSLLQERSKLNGIGELKCQRLKMYQPLATFASCVHLLLASKAPTGAAPAKIADVRCRPAAVAIIMRFADSKAIQR
jgi:hypothetical protein